jgi:hypothetical protein
VGCTCKPLLAVQFSRLAIIPPTHLTLGLPSSALLTLVPSSNFPARRPFVHQLVEHNVLHQLVEHNVLHQLVEHNVEHNVHNVLPRVACM